MQETMDSMTDKFMWSTTEMTAHVAFSKNACSGL